MKKIINSFFLFIVFAVSFQTFAWDSETAKYFPLQVGNMWVYQGTSSSPSNLGRFYHKITISGIVDTLGKRYYKLEHNYIQISGNYSCPIWNIGELMRIDSVSMNIYSVWSFCGNNETLIDSLQSRMNDVSYKCTLPTNMQSVCADTGSYNIFSNNYPSKVFQTFLGPGIQARYVKGIGITAYNWGYQMMQCRDTLRGCVVNGVLYGDTNSLVGISQVTLESPQQFSLSQNYPNPFNPATSIKFDIPKSGFVKLTVFDVLGRETQTLVNEQLSPGSYNYDFDAAHLPSGVYYYKLESENFVQTKKMVLIK